jgi:hypothetical protein
MVWDNIQISKGAIDAEALFGKGKKLFLKTINKQFKHFSNVDPYKTK